MHITFIDLVFSWPPKGGADVDAFNVLQELQTLGHEVRLIGTRCDGIWDRPGFDPQDLPFPARCLSFTRDSFTEKVVVAALVREVSASSSEAVFLGDCFFLKPTLAMALRAYPLAARYYAYEMSCHRDVLRFRDGAPCPFDYLQTPEECRRCALAYLAADLKRDHLLAWTQEYLAAGAYRPGYHESAVSGLRSLDAAVVYNNQMRQLLNPHVPRVFVVPGGVDLHFLDNIDSAQMAQEVSGVPIIFMAGRGEDPAKGLHVLIEAGRRLADRGLVFEVQATAPEDTAAGPWFRPLGWRPHGELPSIYAAADIAVVPSIWEEPFGMVALEAMAAGKPVCASRVGGLQHIVRDGETGYLFDREDSEALALHLQRLIEDAALRRRLGEAGRRVAKAEYSWRAVVERHYLPVIDYLSRCRNA